MSRIGSSQTTQLPIGASTEVKQDSIISSLGNFATEATLAKLNKTMFTGDVTITKTVASPLTTFVKTGTTNITGITTQTIIINSTTGGITKTWT